MRSLGDYLIIEIARNTTWDLEFYEVVDTELEPRTPRWNRGSPIGQQTPGDWGSGAARLEKAVDKGGDVDRLVSIVQRLPMGEAIKVNAREALRRTRQQSLRSVLSVLS